MLKLTLGGNRDQGTGKGREGKGREEGVLLSSLAGKPSVVLIPVGVELHRTQACFSIGCRAIRPGWPKCFLLPIARATNGV